MQALRPLGVEFHLMHPSSSNFLKCFSSQTWYRTVLPLYFPRNQKEEELAMKALPLDLGDEFGEPIILERKIRISDNPVKGSILGH